MSNFNRRYNTVIFDLDGTLVDTGEGIVNSAKYALEKLGFSEPDNKKLFRFIGPPLVDSFEKYYGMSHEQVTKAVKYYREYYSVKGVDENTLYEGIKALLDRIKASGRKIILATSKPEQFAIHILQSHDIDKYFDVIAGATMDTSRVAKKDVLKYALELSGINDVSTAVMVGDRMFDVMGAAEFDIVTIGVTYGYGTCEELDAAGAVYLANSVEEIYKYL